MLMTIGTNGKRFSIQQLEVRNLTAQFVNGSFLANSSDNLADDMDVLYGDPYVARIEIPIVVRMVL